jgi:hypothetical protein
MPRIFLAFFFFALLASKSNCQDSTNFQIKVLNFQKTGNISLGNGLANLEIPPGFKFLDPSQSDYVLQNL